MSGFLVAAVVASTAISLYGQKKEAEAEKAAMQEKIALGNLQADELLARAAINLKQMKREGNQVLSQLGAAAGMRRGSSFSAIRSDLFTRINEEIQFEQRANEFDARMLRMGAESKERAARDYDKVAKIRSFGTVASGAINATNAARK